MERKPRVLVIDDDADILLLCRVNLEYEGFEVITASSAEEGLAKAEQDPPDVLVLDIMMPRLDGWEVLKRLRQHPKTASVPVVALTAKVQTEEQLKAWEEGVAEYMTKPFSPAALSAALKQLLTPEGRSAARLKQARMLSKLRLLGFPPTQAMPTGGDR